MRAVVVLALVAAPAIARADWLSTALDRSDAAGGGTGSAAGSAAAEPGTDDLAQWAGEPMAATLPELLGVAVKQAPALQGARIDIAVAEAQITETWVRHDWLIQAQVNGSKTLAAFAGIALSSEQYGGTADLSRRLPIGGTIDFHVGTLYSDYSGFGPKPTELWQDTAYVALTQPLLKGRGIWLYDSQEQKAQLSRDVSVLARRSVAIQTVSNVVSAYWDLVLAERQVAITQASLDLAKERLRVTEIGAKGGKIADAEIPAVQQIIATREEDVLNGELAVLNASIALRRAAGMQIGAAALGLRVATDLDISDRDLDLKALVQRAYDASPELAELAKQEKGATIDIEVTENGLLPQLDAALSIGPTSQRGAFVSAAEDLAELKSLALTGSLTFSRGIGQHDVRGRVTELRTAREKLRVNEFDLHAQIGQAMARAVASLELAKRRVQLSQRAIELAKQNIKIETDRFNLGTRTNFDVLNRLEELRQAELREAQAKIDWHKAETSMHALTGDILPMFGITFE
jgi:outer membrane protein TolC